MLAILAFASTVTTVQASPVPQTYRVSGISAGGVLNVRAGPSVTAADVGDLGAEAGPLEILEVDASGDWGRVPWRESDGWVAMRYLAPTELPRIDGTVLPVGLRCAGTEPFWGVTLAAPDAVRIDHLGAEAPRRAELTASTESRNGLDFPVALEARDDEARYTLLVRPALCSDGMSERSYGWSADLLWHRDDGLTLLSGCCGIPLRE